MEIDKMIEDRIDAEINKMIEIFDKEYLEILEKFDKDREAFFRKMYKKGKEIYYKNFGEKVCQKEK